MRPILPQVAILVSMRGRLPGRSVAGDAASMGVALLLALAATFLLGGAIAFFPFAGWQGALRLELGLIVFTLLLAVGWLLRRAWPRFLRDATPDATPTDGWAQALGTIALLVVAVSFFGAQGPGRVQPMVDRSIDLPAWWLSSGGVAAAMIAMIFGALSTRHTGLSGSLPGLFIACAGLLSLQPLLSSLGWPTVGPIGLAVAFAALLCYRLALGLGLRAGGRR